MNRTPAAPRARSAVRWAGGIGVILSQMGSAYGLEEGATTAGVAAGAALLSVEDHTFFGPALEASASHGLTDVWAGHVSVGWQSLRLQGARGESARWNTAVFGFVGLRAAYDVLRVIPFATFGAGTAGVTSGPASGLWVGPEAALGAEYLIDRYWSVAPSVRVRALPLRLSREGPEGTLFGADAAVWVGRRF